MGGNTMMKPVVNLIDHNPNWEKQFEYEKKGILNALGNSVIGIEHIGSTSVKGLKAKPIIDIIVGIHNLDEVSKFISPLNEIGFEYVPKPEFKDRKFFRKGRWAQGTCHLHICEFNSSEWIEKLLFRDYLRLNPRAAEEYTLLKKELASKYRFDRSTYTMEKEPFINSIIEKAKKDILN